MVSTAVLSRSAIRLSMNIAWLAATRTAAKAAHQRGSMSRKSA
jgi:hypothetical protein